jgi:hypothetical protein
MYDAANQRLDQQRLLVGMSAPCSSVERSAAQ